MTAIWAAFFVGLTGFVHCLGMCGPFVLHCSGGGRSVLAQLLWHAGRISVYVFLGCLAGFAGSRILSLPAAGMIGGALSYAAAIILLLSALRLLGFLPVRKDGQSLLANLLAPVMKGVLHEQSLAGPAALGLLCGFLPCPMTLAFLALAAAGSSVAQGAGIMAALGVGTMLPLLLLGLSGKLVLPRLGRFVRPVGALVLVALAGTIILRPMALGRCPSCEAAQMRQAAEAGKPLSPCCQSPAKPGAVNATSPMKDDPTTTCPCHAANTASSR